MRKLVQTDEREFRPMESLSSLIIAETSPPLSEAVGLLDEFDVKGKRIDALLNCDMRLSFDFESDRELERAKRILLRYIGHLVGIFLDEKGDSHIRLVGGSQVSEPTE